MYLDGRVSVEIAQYLGGYLLQSGGESIRGGGCSPTIERTRRCGVITWALGGGGALRPDLHIPREIWARSLVVLACTVLAV